VASRNSRLAIDIVSTFDKQGTEGAKTGFAGMVDVLKNTRTEMANTEGFTNKLKVGTQGLGAAFSAAVASPAVLGTAVAGLGAAAFGAANKAADLALEVGRVSEATGASTQDVSRLMEATGDLGIEFGGVEKSIGFMNKTLGNTPAVFAKLGVEVKRTADGAVDTNETFLSVIDTLNAIEDPAEKAAASNKLLGKGWKEMAELIAQGSTKVRDSLNAVADVKVIDPQEVEEARKYRAAMDELGDKFEELALTAGQELVPVLVGVADALVTILEVSDRLGTGFVEAFTSWGDLIADPARQAGLGEMSSEMKALTEEVIAYQRATEAATTETERENRRAHESVVVHADQKTSYEHVGLAAQDLAAAERALTTSTAAATQASIDQRHAVEDLYSTMRSQIDTTYAYEDALETAFDRVVSMNETLADSEASFRDQDEAIDSARDAAIQASKAYVEMKGANLNSKEGIDLQIQSLYQQMLELSEGSPLRLAIAAYIAQLQSIPKNINTRIGSTIVGTTGSVIPIAGQFAEGGVVPGATGSAQLIVAHGGETVLPTHKGGGGQVFPAAPIIINIPVTIGSHRLATVAVDIADIIASRQ
jgi:hypothetical protein